MTIAYALFDFMPDFCWQSRREIFRSTLLECDAGEETLATYLSLLIRSGIVERKLYDRDAVVLDRREHPTYLYKKKEGSKFNYDFWKIAHEGIGAVTTLTWMKDRTYGKRKNKDCRL